MTTFDPTRDPTAPLPPEPEPVPLEPEPEQPEPEPEPVPPPVLPGVGILPQAPLPVPEPEPVPAPSEIIPSVPLPVPEIDVPEIPAPVGDFVTREEFTVAIQAVLASLTALAEGQAARDEALRNELEELRLAERDRAASLLSDIVTQLSEIENRLEVQSAVADESGDGGVVEFFRRVGGFVASPFDSLLSVVGDLILREVRDGLNQ